jgi:hypothetical protein
MLCRKVLPITPYVVNSIPMKQQNSYNENNDGNFQCQTVGNVACQSFGVTQHICTHQMADKQVNITPVLRNPHGIYWLPSFVVSALCVLGTTRKGYCSRNAPYVPKMPV